MDKTIQQKIIDFLDPISKVFVADVRIGLGYTSVRLDNGLGLAWTGRRIPELIVRTGGRDACRKAGPKLRHACKTGQSASEPSASQQPMRLLPGWRGRKLARLMFWNLLIFRPRITWSWWVLQTSRAADSRTGCRLDILELKSETPDTMSPEEGRASLAACSVAIITGTSIITGTLDGLLSAFEIPEPS